MIDQLIFYLVVFLVGAIPLYSCCSALESMSSFSLVVGRARFSWLSIYRLGCVLLECFRGYFVMFFAHEVLLFDFDIFLVVGLFFSGFFITAIFQQSQLTYFWAILWGMYIYIVPIVGVLFPFILFGLAFIGLPILNAYIFVIIIMSLASLISGNHGMYLMYDLLNLCVVYIYKRQVKFRYLSDIVNESNK